MCEDQSCCPDVFHSKQGFRMMEACCALRDFHKLRVFQLASLWNWNDNISGPVKLWLLMSESQPLSEAQCGLLHPILKKQFFDVRKLHSFWVFYRESHRSSSSQNFCDEVIWRSSCEPLQIRCWAPPNHQTNTKLRTKHMELKPWTLCTTPHVDQFFFAALKPLQIGWCGTTITTHGTLKHETSTLRLRHLIPVLMKYFAHS